jgi:hypothetical protein
MDKVTLIKIIKNIEMEEIIDIKIEYVVEKSYGSYNAKDKTEILEIKK